MDDYHSRNLNQEIEEIKNTALGGTIALFTAILPFLILLL